MNRGRSPRGGGGRGRGIKKGGKAAFSLGRRGKKKEGLSYWGGGKATSAGMREGVTEKRMGDLLGGPLGFREVGDQRWTLARKLEQFEGRWKSKYAEPARRAK